MKMTMDVAGLEGAYGDCASACSEWWFYHNGIVQVTRFKFDHGTTGYYLAAPVGNSNWQDLGNGIYTPIYLQWYAATKPASTWYCIHLDIPTADQSVATYDWTLVSTSTTGPDCP